MKANDVRNVRRAAGKRVDHIAQRAEALVDSLGFLEDVAFRPRLILALAAGQVHQRQLTEGSDFVCTVGGLQRWVQARQNARTYIAVIFAGSSTNQRQQQQRRQVLWWTENG